MGFFSWNCNGCGESVKAPYSLPKEIAWQNDCVATTPLANLSRGSYDGYGRINGIDIDSSGAVEMWHQKCWTEAGNPLKYEGASSPTDDQAFVPF